MNELFAKIKRLFQPSPPPTEHLREATADRPPPQAVESPPPKVDRPPLAVEPPPIEPAPAPEPPSDDDADLAEVRAALQAVAETEAAPAEPEPRRVEPDDAIPEPVPEPAADVSPSAASEAIAPETPTALEPSVPSTETVEAPAPPPAGVADALVLTLGAPSVTFTVAKTSATLGRGQENTIRLDDLSVSRRHARIAYRQGGYWLSDLGSMGGTWVNGTRLSAPRRLAAGEVIDIGLLRLTVGFAGGSAGAETKKSAKPRSEAAGQVRRRR